MERKFTIKINSTDKVEELLQEIYDQACKHLNEVQDEMNKFSNNIDTGSEDVPMDSKAKYGKVMHDFFGDKVKAIAAKLEIAKLMSEILKHNGDVNAAINDAGFRKATKLDFKGLRKSLDETEKTGTANEFDKPEVKFYDLK